MAKDISTKSLKDESTEQEKPHSREQDHRPSPSGSDENVLVLQNTVGNQSVVQLLESGMDVGSSDCVQSHSEASKVAPIDPDGQSKDALAESLRKANTEPGSPLDPGLQKQMEGRLDAGLSSVRVHTGPNSATAAENLDARAYTIGPDIHLGRAASQLSEAEQKELLAHEAVHTVQQGSQPVSLQGQMPVSQPDDSVEVEVSQIASSFMSDHTAASPSPALDLRKARRTTAVAPSIQRDIIGSKTWPQGKFEINFTKNEAAAAGAFATEDGTVKFTPSKTAPESDSIRFVQIARAFDTTTGGEFDWTGTPQAALNKMQTARDVAKNIAPGFHVDQRPDLLNKRTKKADPAVLPFYDAMLANHGNQVGKRKGKIIKSAILDDHPGFSGPLKINFVTSAKAADTGTEVISMVHIA